MPININNLQASEFQVNPVATEDDLADYALSDMTNVTTIDGGKITTGEIRQGNYNASDNTKNSKWNLDTGEFVTHNSDGSFVLDSTATGTDLDPNIQGAYIKGGTIEGSTITGSTINASTMNIRNLTVLSDSDMACYPVFTSRSSVEYSDTPGMGVAFISVTINTGIYTSSYTSPQKKRLASDSETEIVVFEGTAAGGGYKVFSWFRNFSDGIFKVRVGDTVLGSFSLNGSTPSTTFSIAGMEFYWFQPDQYITIKQVSVPNLPQNGELIFYLEGRSHDAWYGGPSGYGTTFMVTNI